MSSASPPARVVPHNAPARLSACSQHLVSGARFRQLERASDAAHGRLLLARRTAAPLKLTPLSRAAIGSSDGLSETGPKAGPQGPRRT
jgi:hypothetical protein